MTATLRWPGYTGVMEYVDQRYGGFYAAGSRVSLASIIYGFRDGDSPETIQQNFPSLTLAQVYGALAFYLNHPAECEQYLAELDRLSARLAEATAQSPKVRQPSH